MIIVGKIEGNRKRGRLKIELSSCKEVNELEVITEEKVRRK